ncbi:sigma-70 family RNA polymerase sigma factor [Antribacter sp. KLBMP9083]|uniref:Sigma-70 family RNA polymerase sigma factor n=1 Tax=Antribacter soli TaxID=2910976 RepID=A0AA41QF04_9MICO|nr:sigma-70 family RNA polymerase sigma factor [Antribacter soli]MCF4121446.1 sigma-70 family RNA polymerase sigma factor [Antribacter soli]
MIERTPTLSAVEQSLLLARIADGHAAAGTLAATAVSNSLRLKLEVRVKDGQSARERLVLAHLRLVPDVAATYADSMPFADLLQEGSLGLVRAVESYVPARGSFTAYARRWIRRSIARAIAASSHASDAYATVTTDSPDPERLSLVRRRVHQALAHLDALEARVLELRFGLLDGTVRSLDEIGRRLGVTRERVRQILEIALARLRHVVAPLAPAAA